MAQLEQVTVGSIIKCVAGNEPVTVVAVKWFGTAGLELTYKTSNGKVYNQLVFREALMLMRPSCV